MSDPKLQQEVRQELKRRGFDFVRFAAPPLGEARERFLAWLAKGYQGNMAYLGRRQAERAAPEMLLQGLRSVIVLGHSYDSGLPNTMDPTEANISRYAWGEDYHEVIGQKLRGFQIWLAEKVPQVSSFVGVDAAPILEKAWAEKSGVGWLGKHTNIIHAQCGSYFFLASILCDIAFVPDEAERDRCGSCTRCLVACPTGAIVAPYQLDARLCISYLTIELKGSIPRDLRPMIGNRIFGCDDCQEVCPWNRFSRPTKEGRFFPREGVRAQSLVSFASLTEAEFKRKFAGSAILRAKRRGFLRNLCVALGNSGSADSLVAVASLLKDPEALVRAHAVWAYARLRQSEAKSHLRRMRENETDELVLNELEIELQPKA